MKLYHSSLIIIFIASFMFCLQVQAHLSGQREALNRRIQRMETKIRTLEALRFDIRQQANSNSMMSNKSSDNYQRLRNAFEWDTKLIDSVREIAGCLDDKNICKKEDTLRKLPEDIQQQRRNQDLSISRARSEALYQHRLEESRRPRSRRSSGAR